MHIIVCMHACVSMCDHDKKLSQMVSLYICSHMRIIIYIAVSRQQLQKDDDSQEDT